MPSTLPFHAFVIDDDAEIRAALTELLETMGWTVSRFSLAREALKAVKSKTPDALVLDVQMPGMSGLEMLRELDQTNAPPVVLISAHGDIPMAVEAMQAGAYTFLEKPYDPRRLLAALTHAAEQHRLRQNTHRLQQRLASLTGLDAMVLGQSALTLNLRQNIIDVAQTDAAVLITGPTGAGKDLVARAIHQASQRSEQNFVTLNCATLTPERVDEMIFAPQNAEVLKKAAGGTLKTCRPQLPRANSAKTCSFALVCLKSTYRRLPTEKTTSPCCLNIFARNTQLPTAPKRPRSPKTTLAFC